MSESESPIKISRKLGESRSIAIDLLAMVGLFALVAMLYWPTTRFEFLNWDDPWYVLNNDLIKSWSLSNLKQIATEPVARNYAPITIFSFLVDHSIWGEKATGYHLINVVLHLINGMLVFKLLARLTTNRLIAWGTAAMFIVHPMQVETVAWVSSRKGLLSAAFMLASLYCWLPKESSGRREGYGFLFFIGALLCKAIAIMVPPIVVIWQVLVNRRSFSEAVVRQFVPVVLSVLLLLYTMSAQTTIVGGIRGHIGFSKFKLLAIDAVIIWKYFLMLLWPTQQCVLYDPPTEGIWLPIVVSVCGLLALSAIAWKLKDRVPRGVCAFAIFGLLLLPVMNLFPITTLMNDRYLYLPSIPFFGLLVAAIWHGLNWLAGRIRLPGTAFAHSLAAICVLFSVLHYGRVTERYLPVWKNSLSLWTYATQQTPSLAVTWIQLGLTHHGLGNHEQAIEALETAKTNCPLDGPDKERVDRMLTHWKQQQGRTAGLVPIDQPGSANNTALRTEFDSLLRARKTIRVTGSLK